MRVPTAIRRLVEKSPFTLNAYRTLRDLYAYSFGKPETNQFNIRMSGQSPQMKAQEYEVQETKLFLRLFPLVDVFIDIGANIGYYSCLASSRGKKILAFEPHPTNLRYLFRNLEENGWSESEVFPVALGKKPAITSLFGTGGGSSLIRNWKNQDASESFFQYVSVSTLDIVLGDRFNGQRVLVKIDVEGLEFDVLQGAIDTLQYSPPPIWFVEIVDRSRGNYTNPHMEATFRLFWSHGYKAFMIDNRIEAISETTLEEWKGVKAKAGSRNFLFLGDPSILAEMDSDSA